MADESDLERTEPASPRRLEQARAEGQVPQSRELSAFLILIAGSVGIWSMGSWFAERAAGLMRQGLTLNHGAAYDPNAMTTALWTLSSDALLTIAPLLVALLVAALAGPLAIGGFVFSPKAFQPDFSRLNPVAGLGRMFSSHGLAELVKSVFKTVLIGGVAWIVLSSRRDELFALFLLPTFEGMGAFVRIISLSAIAIVASMALIAAIDVPFQLWQYYSKLKMTKEELRQEAKEQEGDPHVKGRIRAQQREMARRRMMAEVPKADVVVTNPTHFSVALKYDSKRMGAPRVVAKGAGLLAQRIREVASENKVPLLEVPPLARALYKYTEPGDEIPAALYTAVAEVMAYIYQLNAHLSSGGLPPQMPVDLAVPEGMDPGAQS